MASPLSYQIIPNIIFIVSVLGILLIILRHLPEAERLKQSEQNLPVEQKLTEKGLPIVAVSALRSKLQEWVRRLWNFMLEAKDLKPNALAGYKIKKIFKEKERLSLPPKVQSTAQVSTPASTTNEQELLDTIKQNPKDLTSYDLLGKYYIDAGSFADSRDIYLYLTGHAPTNPLFQARLGYSFYRLRQYKKAADHYKKSLALDNSQPNRYYNLGLSLEAYGDKQGSVEAFEKAISLEPKNMKFYVTLANLHVKYGNRDKSKAALQRAHSADPSNAEIKAKLRELS